jgi:hypothetical protein
MPFFRKKREKTFWGAAKPPWGIGGELSAEFKKQVIKEPLDGQNRPETL